VTAVELYGQLLAVFATFGLLGAALWLLRRTGRISWPAGGGDAARELVVREKRQLSPAHALHLLEVRGRTILVATHPAGVGFHELGETFEGALRQSLRASGGGGQ
jgi:flagellar biogenesis protein FliO